MSQEYAQAKRWRHSSAEVSELVAKYRTGGRRQTGFCRRHGLDLSTLERRLAGRRQSAAQGASATNWVAVGLNLSADAKAGPPASGVVLVVGPYRIRPARGFHGETLWQLLGLMVGRWAMFIWRAATPM